MNNTTTYRDSEVKCREDGRLTRRARDRECLREIRAILHRVYGKRAVASLADRRS